jgi:hypothetical protein
LTLSLGLLTIGAACAQETGYSRVAMVVRALAFKWIRILFRCWKDHKPYSEEVYRQALARRQRCASKGSPVQLQWKNCAGFSKITAITS